MTDKVDYEQFVVGLMKAGEEILSSLTPEKAEMMHMAAGVSGEAGELLDAIKKHVFYNKALDLENTIEELGDLEFYMQGLRSLLDISRDEVLQHNYNKLSKRYHKGTYSDEQAIRREDKNESN